MPRRPAIRVLIADDNRTMRLSLRARLDHADGITVVGEASSGPEAVRMARAERADVVLMDLQMPGGSGLSATRALASPDTDNPVRVVVLTAHAVNAYVIEALAAGAVGYLLKSDTRGLLTEIRRASRGEVPLAARLALPVIQELVEDHRAATADDDAALDALSPAERRVVAMLSRGHSTNEDIAAALVLSVNTVRFQISAALKKTGLADRTLLALWGVRHRLDRGPLPEPPSE